MKLSRLARRMFTADIWAPSLLALFVAVVSGLVTLAPRALAQADAEYLASRVGEVSAVRGDLRARWDTEVAVGGSGTDDPWGVWFDSLNRLRAAQPEPLRGLLGSPQILAHLGAQSVFIPQGTEFYQVRVTLTANPEMTSQFELVSGRWPQPGVSPQTGNVEVVLPDDVAARIGKRAGDALGEGIALVGTVRIADPAAPRWRFDPSLQLEQEVDPNNGTAAAVAAFMAPEDLLNVAAESGTRVGFFVWYPLDAASLAAGRVSLPELRTQLVGFQSDVREVVPAGALEPALKRQEARFDTGLTEVLDGIVKQQRTTASLVAVVVAGPVGVAVALMLVAVRMVLQRHRATLVITRSRGASPRQLRVWAAGWGLLAGMPAALLGHLAATLLVPFDIGAWQWLPTIVAGLLPAAMLALGVEATTPTGRKDLSVSGGGRWRIAAEVAVLAGAALACWQLFTRDAGSEAGIDWLATLTPLALAAAGCVAALRFYPLPLTGLVRWFRRGPGLTGFLGATRALRAPTAGGVPAMAVVLGAAVAVAGVGLFGTVSHGARAAVWQDVGAAVKLSGPRITDDLLAKVRAIDGVVAAGRLFFTGNQRDLKGHDVRLWLAEPELARVWAQGIDTQPPREFWEDGEPKVLTSEGIGRGTATLAELGRARLVGSLPALPGAGETGDWALARTDQWRASPGSPTILLVATGPGVDPAAIAAQLQELEPYAQVLTAADGLAAVAAHPALSLLQRIFAVSGALAGVFAVAAVLLVQVMGGPDRLRLLAVLRTMGATGEQARGVTAWELGPLVGVALSLGVGLGLGTGWLLVSCLDLSGLTTGNHRPAWHPDLVALAAVVAALVCGAAAAVVVSARAAGRASVSRVLRIGEEG